MTDRAHPEAGSIYIIRYALELGLLWIDGDGRDKVREALDALDALEAKLASIGAGGVQALSAAPAGWRELAARVMDALADAQDKTNSEYPEHVKCYPSWASHARWLRWHADMFRTGKPVGNGAGQPGVLAALAASPTPPAEQQAQPSDAENLRRALRFYADGEHFIKSDGDAWDTVSGEPQNYWCDEAGTATVEDGSIAKLALEGHAVRFEDDDTPQPKAAPQQEAQEPVALLVRKNSWRAGQWEAAPPDSPSYGLAWANQRQYVYAAPQPAPAPLSDGVLKDAERFRELYRMTALLGTPAGNAYQEAMESEMVAAFKEADSDLAKISIEQYRRVIDAGFAAAALAAQGGK